MQIEQKPYATSWTLGGTTRASETLTIPASQAVNFQDKSFSVECSIKVSPDGSNQAILVQEDPTNPRTIDKTLHLLVRDSKLYFGFYSDDLAGTINVADNYFHSVCFTYDALTKTKCIFVDGQVDVMGTSKNTYQGTVNTTYIGSWPARERVLNGIIDDLRISNRARTLAEHQAAYQNNQPLPLDAFTTCKLSFDSTLHANPTVNQVNAIFTRSSIAYKQDGTQVASNSPRYEAGKFNQGIMIEEGTTNLFMVNQSSVETDLAGFNSWQSTLASVITEHWHGIACVEMTLNVSSGTTSANYILSSPVVVGDIYTGSAYVKGVPGKKVRITIRRSGGANPYSDATSSWVTLTGAWQRINITGEIDYADRTNLAVILWGQGAIGDKFYFDGLQLEQKPYNTSWTLGGTTRAAETLTIPTSGVFQKGNWTVELVYTPTSSTNTGVWSRLWDIHIDTNNRYTLCHSPSGQLVFDIVSGGAHYRFTDSNALSVGQQYQIMASANGTVIRLCKNSVQIGNDLPYTEPVGTLPTYMYVGSNLYSFQCNGIIDDLRISNRARTLAEHQAAYQNNQPLTLDSATTCKLSFDGSLNAIGVGPTPTRFIYDYNNRLDYIEMPSGSVVDYKYDANGNLIWRTIHY
ncbi:MAG: LamG-like jellyroll fold domain-containing protein [Dehalobacterium sp.]